MSLQSETEYKMTLKKLFSSFYFSFGKNSAFLINLGMSRLSNQWYINSIISIRIYYPVYARWKLRLKSKFQKTKILEVQSIETIKLSVTKNISEKNRRAVNAESWRGPVKVNFLWMYNTRRYRFAKR